MDHDDDAAGGECFGEWTPGAVHIPSVDINSGVAVVCGTHYLRTHPAAQYDDKGQGPTAVYDAALRLVRIWRIDATGIGALSFGRLHTTAVRHLVDIHHDIDLFLHG